MQPLFGNEQKQTGRKDQQSAPASWSTMVLGFIGSAIICWIVLGVLAPIITGTWGVVWIAKLWPRVAITAVVAVGTAALLTRIEGTIWGKYYVIVGYLLSLGMIIWIVLRLLHYV